MKVPTAKELTEQLIPKAYRIPMLRPDGSPNDRVTIEERSTEDSVRRWAVVTKEQEAKKEEKHDGA